MKCELCREACILVVASLVIYLVTLNKSLLRIEFYITALVIFSTGREEGCTVAQGLCQIPFLLSN